MPQARLKAQKSLWAAVVDTAASFTAEERARMISMCDGMGADWAELDVLRDRTSGLLYVVDVNPPTPWPVVSRGPTAEVARIGP